MSAGLLLIAASGLAREVLAAGITGVVGILDDNSDLHETEVAGVPVIGSVADAISRPESLLENVVLTADVMLGTHAVVMPNSTITHDDVLDDFVTPAAGFSLGDAVHIREAAYVGMNITVRERLTVGFEATVGMGAVVLADVPDEQTWVGAPARALGGEG